MTSENNDSRTLSRREARSIERSAIAEGRRATRSLKAGPRHRSASAPTGVRRAAIAIVGGVAVVGFLAATLAPVIGSQVAEASQDPSASRYATAADEAQLFAAANAGSLSALGTVSYEAELRTPTPTPTPEVAAVAAPGQQAEAPAEAEQPGSVPAPYSAPEPFTGGGSPEEWMTAAGIAESDWGYVDYVVSRESGWNPNATNPSSGACGLVQAYPCSKVPGGGYDPVANLQWANGYAVGRYGSWAGAYAFWVSNNWW